MTRAILGIFFIAVIGVSAISICQGLFKNARLDMTENKLYTLSDGTKNILQGLNQPVTMKLFYTKTAALKGPDQIRYYNNYYTYVLALLQEYETQAKGNVKLEVVDPRPYTDEEMAAVRYGLKRIPMSEDENFIFGLVVQTEFGVTKTIEFFTPDRQQFVEYDISYLIDTAITRQKKRLGVLSSLDLMGDTDYMAQMKRMQGQQAKRKWGIIAHLEKQFEVSTIPADTDAITDIDLLMVVHPKDLPEKTVFAIDQFILKGGRAIVCVDPHCVADPPDMTQRYGAEHDSSSNLAKLLNNWGLIMPANTFAGDSKLAVVGATRPGQKPEKILGIMKLASAYDCFNSDSAISAQLGEVTVVFPGVLKIKETNTDDEAEKLDYTPLISTSHQGNSWRVDNRFELMSPDYAKFMRQFRKGEKPVSMGYMVTGMFKSAFPDGIQVPDDSTEASEEEEAPKTKTVTGLTQADDSCAVVVLADVDILSDMVAYQRSFFGLSAVGDNSTLIINALEDLSGSSNLISIRSRGNFKRPFIMVDQLEADADEKTAKEEEKVMAQIKGFEQQLNEKLQALQGEGKGELINQTIVEEKKEIELELRKAEKQLRDIKMQKREEVEALKRKMRNLCTLYGPGLTLAIAIVLGIYRSIKRRHYISHASDS
jgi:ABC-type uncharacterized transport system involved in gliding motility auxiliary subunit